MSKLETKQWTTMDKSTWGAGPWQDEPDKMQWEDEATGLPCLIVRNGSGSLCGYVGVSPAHPYFGIHYNGCTQKAQVCEDEGYCSHTPDLSAHGGITFTNFCQTPTHEMFMQWRGRMFASRKEAEKYPVGDAAERIREEGHLVDSYEAWVEHANASSICHVVAEDEGKTWWFGFDCAHGGDLSPKYAHKYYSAFGRGEYRTVAYVQQQCVELARQLAEVAR